MPRTDPAHTPVVVDGLRTPFGRYGGALREVRPDDLAAHIIRVLLDRTGVVCGIRVEDIEDPLMQKIRWMDKLVDELAKGKKMAKILRSSE